MGYQREWTGDFDEGSEFDLAESAEGDGEEDPEASADWVEIEVSEVPEEADAADAAEQSREVPADDEEARGD